MLEVGRVVHARSEHHHGGVVDVARRHLAQVVQQQVGVVRHRGHARAAEHLGHQPHRHLAVLQHVRHARGHAQVVLQHVELAGVGAHDVDARHVAVDVLGHGHVLHLGAVLGVEEHLLGRHDARAHDVVVVVDVVDEHVQRAHALLQPLVQPPPLGRGDDARDQVERDQALGAVGVARHREGDADAAEVQIRLQAARRHGLVRLAGKPLGKGVVMRAHVALGVQHFVEGAFGDGFVGCCVAHGLGSSPAAPLVAWGPPWLRSGNVLVPGIEQIPCHPPRAPWRGLPDAGCALCVRAGVVAAH